MNRVPRDIGPTLCEDRSEEFVEAALRELPHGTEQELLGVAMRLARGAANPARVLDAIRRRASS